MQPSTRPPAVSYNAPMKKLAHRIPWWLVVLIAGAALIVLGIAQGDFQDTVRKAALVCYECIGIG